MSEFRGTTESLTQSKLGLVPTIRTRSRRTNLSAVACEREGGAQTLIRIPGKENNRICLKLPLGDKAKGKLAVFLVLVLAPRDFFPFPFP